jgi:hypothetical protein
MVTRSNIQRDSVGTRAVVRAPIDRGRLGVYTALGGSLGSLPLPWVPDVLARRVRGALLHDIAVRHGLSLSPEARRVLADPAGPDGPRGFLMQAARFVGMRVAGRALGRIGPWGMIWPARDALRTFVLGHLFDRYLDIGRPERAVRIDAEEAGRVRRALDGALVRALTVEAMPTEEPTPIDDQRDATTALLDGLIGLVAGVPDRLVRRLDTAFDELLAHPDG